MNPQMHITLLNTYPQKKIATVLKTFDYDQLHAVDEIAGPFPEILLEYGQILEKREIMS